MGKDMKNVEIFKYLGCLIANANEVETEINARIIACNKYYRALGHILQKRHKHIH
jgi:hypothetical protein